MILRNGYVTDLYDLNTACYKYSANDLTWLGFSPKLQFKQNIVTLTTELAITDKCAENRMKIRVRDCSHKYWNNYVTQYAAIYV